MLTFTPQDADKSEGKEVTRPPPFSDRPALLFSLFASGCPSSRRGLTRSDFGIENVEKLNSLICDPSVC